jgi:hypothetical protein
LIDTGAGSPAPTSDPLHTVWDALERVGCEPHGTQWDFRSRCPAHDGENPSALHVSVGVGGQAILWCFAHQCAAEDIARALGLAVADLFPPGHRRARRRRLPDARRADFHGNARMIVNVLAALQALGGNWSASVRCACGYCGAPAAVLFADREQVGLMCPGDPDPDALGHWTCTVDQFTQALAGRVEDAGERHG